MAGLNGHQERRSASIGGSGFGGIWISSEVERERIGTGFIPVSIPLVWPTAEPDECEGMGWEGE